MSRLLCLPAGPNKVITSAGCVQVGVTQVKAHRRPIVGVLSSGNELVEAFVDVTPTGKIRDSNRPMLLSLLEDWDVETVDLGVCGDKKEDLKRAVMEGLQQVDVLITSGGVSMVRRVGWIYLMG